MPGYIRYGAGFVYDCTFEFVEKMNQINYTYSHYFSYYQYFAFLICLYQNLDSLDYYFLNVLILENNE